MAVEQHAAAAAPLARQQASVHAGRRGLDAWREGCLGALARKAFPSSLSGATHQPQQRDEAQEILRGHGGGGGKEGGHVGGGQLQAQAVSQQAWCQLRRQPGPFCSVIAACPAAGRRVLALHNKCAESTGLITMNPPLSPAARVRRLPGPAAAE